MITVNVKGDFKKSTSYMERLKEIIHISTLDKYGRAGVEALSAATPVDSGETASSWSYRIVHNGERSKIVFTNSAMDDAHVPIAILLQYGHATKSGGYIEGRDYINPAIQPLFDQIADDAWKEVTKL